MPVFMPVDARMNLGVYAVEGIVHHAIQVKPVCLSTMIAYLLENIVAMLQIHVIAI